MTRPDPDCSPMKTENPQSPRWCATCDRYTDHHTDRHTDLDCSLGDAENEQEWVAADGYSWRRDGACIYLRLDPPPRREIKFSLPTEGVVLP